MLIERASVTENLDLVHPNSWLWSKWYCPLFSDLVQLILLTIGQQYKDAYLSPWLDTCPDGVVCSSAGSSFLFLRNRRTNFYSSYISLHSHSSEEMRCFSPPVFTRISFHDDSLWCELETLVVSLFHYVYMCKDTPFDIRRQLLVVSYFFLSI